MHGISSTNYSLSLSTGLGANDSRHLNREGSAGSTRATYACMPLVPSHRAAGQGANRNQGRHGMGHRSPGAAEGDIQRIRGDPNFGIQLPDYSHGHKYWVSGISCSGASAAPRAGRGSPRHQEGGWGKTQRTLGTY